MDGGGASGRPSRQRVVLARFGDAGPRGGAPSGRGRRSAGRRGAGDPAHRAPRAPQLRSGAFLTMRSSAPWPRIVPSMRCAAMAGARGANCTTASRSSSTPTARTHASMHAERRQQARRLREAIAQLPCGLRRRRRPAHACAGVADRGGGECRDGRAAVVEVTVCVVAAKKRRFDEEGCRRRDERRLMRSRHAGASPAMPRYRLMADNGGILRRGRHAWFPSYSDWASSIR